MHTSPNFKTHVPSILHIASVHISLTPFCSSSRGKKNASAVSQCTSVKVYRCTSVQLCNCALVQLCISQRSHFTTHPISPIFLPLTIAPLRNSSSILFPANISLTSLMLLSFTICENLMYEAENTKAPLAAFCEP